MKKSVFSIIKSSILTLVILVISFFISVLMQDVFGISEHVTTIFVFAVFLISLFTEGYVWGMAATVIGVFAVQYAFTYPYFGLDFSNPASLLSAIVMLIVSILTSGLTLELKRWQTMKAESEKERMRANLLRAVSHDLRTPLTTIYGASSLILESHDKLTEEQLLQMASGIKEDSEWLIRMVENLLSITRIDSGTVKLEKTPTVLEEIVDTVLIKFKKRYPCQIIKVNIPDEVIIIPMDAILIEQVIINIFENVIHHAESFTEIIFTVKVEGDEAIFSIADDGVGIPKEKLDRIFTGYNDKTEESSDTKSRNAGIGLSVCATIIKAHGGKISAKNREVGGAEITFTLKTEGEIYEQQV